MNASKSGSLAFLAFLDTEVKGIVVATLVGEFEIPTHNDYSQGYPSQLSAVNEQYQLLRRRSAFGGQKSKQ